MTFTDKTIFNIRLRTPVPLKDIDSRNISDDDYVFHQPFRSDVEGREENPLKIVREKTARLLRQAARQKEAAARTETGGLYVLPTSLQAPS
ncbi:hypothetical protein [Comamonas sp. 4034]|uniref:hypothetical protein n=1 Tax=Comamonas sp. 4034 TaxID=3156455 RepID=UPI003D23B4D1